MLRHIGWLFGSVAGLLMSWAVHASPPMHGDLWSVHPLTGVLRSALLTPPAAWMASKLFHPPRIRVGPATSTNWSGYVITGPAGSVSDVIGSWSVPTVSCAPGETSAASFWVGIDGDSSRTVEQIGTDSDCQNGTPAYYAWFELFPLAARIIGTVIPGDVIKAEVRYDASSNKFVLSITDVTQNASFAVARWFPAQRKSAEWIAEAPASTTGILPLANFGAVGYGEDFTAVSATNNATINGQSGPIASFGSAVQVITMISQSNAVKAQPSGLSPDGTSFSIAWGSRGP